MTPYRKKLIEVALPLKAINEASAREKSIRHGHPSTLHLWWARRPLAACRAVLFASLVDDPDSDPVYRKADGTVDEDRAGVKRAQLFNLIEELVQWENSNNPRVINAARAEIARCVASRKIEFGELAKDTIIFGDKKGQKHPKGPISDDGTTAWEIVLMKARPEVVNAFLAEYAPPVLDPFCGGGSIPLEAQRLGLRAYASDLNPVPVLITKALIEIPPKFAGRPPVNPKSKIENPKLQVWQGAQGLAEDVRYYGQWMRDEAEKRIGHLYPKVKITKEMAKDRPDLKEYVGQELTVIAWLWARTVASPNPACGGAHVPLVNSFWLSTKKGKEAYVEPVIDRKTNSYRFVVRTGKPKDKAAVDTGTKLGRGCKFRCLLSDQPIPESHIKDAGMKGQLGATLLAVVAEGTRGRVYLSPECVPPVRVDRPKDLRGIDAPLADDPRNLWCLGYGLNTFDKLFTPRQLVALTTFSDLVQAARAKVLADARGSGLWPDGNQQVGLEGRPPSGAPPDGNQQVGDARGSGLWPDSNQGVGLVDSRHCVGLEGRPPSVTDGNQQVGLEGRPPSGAPPAKGYYRRGEKHPPHLDEPGLIQHVTFRLAGSLPASRLAELKESLGSQRITAEQYREELEAELDKGHGPDWLRQPAVADIVQKALEHFDGQRYDLLAWNIMPNHVHVLFAPRAGYRLPDILHSWKSFTAKECNRLLNRRGPFWQDDYFDRYIRDDDDYWRTTEYVLNNGGRASSPTLANRIHEIRPARGSGLWPDSNQGVGLADSRHYVGLEGRPPAVTDGNQQVGLEGRPPAGQPPSDLPLADGGTGPQAYADAVATYLAFAIDRALDRCSTICSWDSSPKMEALRSTFSRQALPMTWDFAEGNPFSESSGNWNKNLEWVTLVIEKLPHGKSGAVKQLDATAAINGVESPMISTDPPYYDNIGYADLSDFFYVWLRRSLKDVYPSLFATALTPKAQELIASPYRHDGDKRKAQEFFETGLGQAFARMHEAHAADYPLTVYYAFKQQEEDDFGERASRPHEREEAAGTAAPPVSPPVSTGWETMLAGLIRAGFAITGTWPMRTELGNRMVGMGTNALASSIVLVCRPRPADARLATRKEFINALRQELPEALKNLQHGNIAPVDMAQSAIGPGMAVFTRYSKVIESDGKPMSVRTALGIINQVLDEVLAEQEGDFDADTRWALAWFDQHGMEEGPFGVAETLSKAKNTAVNGLVEAGVVKARGGKVRLVKREELPDTWDPATDKRLTVWETTQHLIRTLQTKGESEAATLLNKLGGLGETARELAYRLYSICERKKWADEALAYNSLVIAWPELSKLALSSRNRQTSTQQEMF
jgi:putative DNA methylase